MSQPTPSDVHVNRPLSQISIAFMQNASNFVADRVFPNIPVEKQSDTYWVYDRTHFNRDEMQVRAPNAESKGSGYEVSTTPYYAPVFAFHHDIPDQVRANADSAIVPDRDATMLVSSKALIKREKTWAARYFQPGVWGTTQTTVMDWDGTGNPIVQIRSAKRSVLLKTGFEPNTLVLGKRAADLLIDNALVVDRIQFSNNPAPAMVRMGQLAQLLELDRIFVMSGIENTAVEGAAESNAFIGTDVDALLCYAAPSPGMMIPSAGYTFSWNGMFGSSALGSRVSRFRMEAIKSDRVEIEMAYVQQLISADLGYFFDDVTAA